MIQTFNNKDFSLSIYGTADQPLFKGCEVATLLGYKNTRKALIDHVEPEDKKTLNDKSNESLPYDKKVCPQKVTLPKMHPQTIFINESGVYSLILASKLPKAKQFKHWITSEVTIDS